MPGSVVNESWVKSRTPTVRSGVMFRALVKRTLGLRLTFTLRICLSLS
jgi:hypothetical protein